MTSEPPADEGQEPGGGRWPTPQAALEAGIDFDRANAARMYDHFLGGGHNFAVDREVAEKVASGNPDIAAVARANRAYLGRVVRWCLAAGIDQFLDLGSGVPTVGNVHEIAHQTHAAARVAYVDFEPVAVAHAQAILAEDPGRATVTITRADLRDPASVLAAPGVADLLDLGRPVALLAIAVLHFVPDPTARAALDEYRAAMAPGSALAISHASDDHDDPVVAERVRGAAAGYAHSATPLILRGRGELRDLFAGFELVPPGLVDVRDWPVPQPDQPGAGGYGGVGRLR